MVTGEESTRPMLNADSEIVSIFVQPSCPKPPSFPIENNLALYGILLAEVPLLCGFNEQERGCFRYQSIKNNWTIEQFVLHENRSHASSVSYGNDSWIIIGGQAYHNGLPIILDSSEILRHHQFVQGPKLPIPLSGHCSVNIDDGQIFIAGGYGEPQLKDSFILNIKENSLEYLDLMIYGRFGHACGKVMTLFNEIELIVAGGLHQNRIEKYSFVHKKWFALTIMGDQPTFKAATIQGKRSFLITGGVELEPYCTTSNCRQDTIKQYDNSLSVLIVKKKLNHGRGNHLAIPLPTYVCSGKDFELSPIINCSIE